MNAMISKLFMLLLLPVSLFVFYFNREKDNRAHLLLVMFTGILTASVFVFIKILFAEPYYMPEVSFLKAFLYFYLGQTFFPMAVVWALFLLFARKDTVSDRFTLFFPMLAAFYAIYLPYRIIDEALPYSAFCLFVKPVLYLAMLAIVHDFFVRLGNNSFAATGTKILNWIITVVLTCVPTVAEIFWYQGYLWVIWAAISVVYTAYAAYLVLPKKD